MSTATADPATTATVQNPYVLRDWGLIANPNKGMTYATGGSRRETTVDMPNRRVRLLTDPSATAIELERKETHERHHAASWREFCRALRRR